MNNARQKYVISLFLFILSDAAWAITATKTIDWRGLTAGGFVGTATATKVTTTEPLRLDNDAHWFRPFANTFHYNTDASFIGGASLGYNWQFCDTPYLIGVEGEYGYLNLRGNSVDPNQYPYAAQPGHELINESQTDIKIGSAYGYALIGGRLGYIWGNSLLYIKSGAVFSKIQSKYASVKTEDMKPVYLNLAGTNSITGYGIGGGVEYALPYKGFSTKLEYLYVGINKTLDVYGHCSCDFLWRMTEHLDGIHTVKIGLNYTFDIL